MISFEVSIPLVPILVVAGFCGGLVGLIVSFFGWRTLFDLDRARHNYMAHEIAVIRQRNNDWADVPGDPWVNHWYDRLIRKVLDRRSRMRREREDLR